MRRARLLLGSGALLCFGCASEVPAPTQVIVSVSTDLAPGALTRVEAQARDPVTKRAGETHVYLVAPAASGGARGAPVSLPFSFGLARGVAEQVELVLTGYGPLDDGRERAVVEYRTSLRFRAGRTLLLDVPLHRACLLSACPPQQACYPDEGGATCADVRTALLREGSAGDEVQGWDVGAAHPTLDAAAEAGPPMLDGGEVDARVTPDRTADASSTTVDAGAPLQVDPCRESDCAAGTACRVVGDAYTCDCGESGYEGARCERDLDECASPDVCHAPDYPCLQTEPPGYVCAGQFADWPMPVAQPGAQHPPSYDVSMAGVVLDRVTGLMWQRDVAATMSGCSGTVENLGDVCTQPEAERYCDGLELAGISDWRLPTAIELTSLVDETRTAAAIDPMAFPDTPSEWYWSSSTFVGASVAAWEIDFQTGRLEAVRDNAISHNRARCVRSEGAPLASSQRYRIDASADTVSDQRTGLVWQRTPLSDPHDLAGAKAACAALGAGYRLPALKELATLLDPMRISPAIDPVFAGTRAERFWSASASAASATEGWTVDFAAGHFTTQPVTSIELVRCVQ